MKLKVGDFIYYLENFLVIRNISIKDNRVMYRVKNFSYNTITEYYLNDLGLTIILSLD